MELDLLMIWSDSQRLHRPEWVVHGGVRNRTVEVAERLERIRDALMRAGVRVRPPASHGEERILEVHDKALLEYLENAWKDWEKAGYPAEKGHERIVPFMIPHPALLAGAPLRVPPDIAARSGRFTYDTVALVGPGTWQAARDSIDVALTAADVVAAGDEWVVYACGRPPGHHATRSAFGGSCYLNNAAAAAASLRQALGSPVAVIDIDAHHGNGTQAIFYDDPSVLTGSVHIDPGAGWYPHFVGFADEAGVGNGEGANRNLPLPPGTGDDQWLEAVAELATWARDGGSKALVIALGVDAEAEDPESPLNVTDRGFRTAGEMLGRLGLPTVVIQEGGYRPETIGELVLAALDGIVAGSREAID